MGPSLRGAPFVLAVAALTLTMAAPVAQAQLAWPEGVSNSYNRMTRAERRARAARYERRAETRSAKQARVAEKEQPKPQGPLLVAISIEKQQLKLYDSNGLFTESPVSTGTRDHPTPLGVFSIIGKEVFHRSNIYSGAPMPHMQRITWSGVAMHAGVLPGYPASHGCIRLPASFASRMYGWTKRGARVLITPGELTPADIAHPQLIARRPDPVAVAAAPEKKDGVQTADAAGGVPAAPIGIATATPGKDLASKDLASKDLASKDLATKDLTAKDLQPKKPVGHISAFVSAKTGKLYLRQGFEPLFDVPVTIAGNNPLGTHVFTMRSDKTNPDALVWSAVTMPVLPRAEKAASAKRKKDQDTIVAAPPPQPATAAEALDRITIPDDAKQKIAASLAPGDSLVISDQGLGDETGEGTDFIVLLR